jgi:hypothetical protein
MSDYIMTHHYNMSSLILQLHFVGEDFETGSIKFKLEAVDGRPTLNESPFIPVKCLFDMSYLIEKSIRIYMLKIEEEAIRITKKETTNGTEENKAK